MKYLNASNFESMNFDDGIYLNNITALTRDAALSLRSKVAQCIDNDYSFMYVDAQDAKVVDLSGINEVIHAHYVLRQASRKFIFVYKKSSNVAKWVETTGLDKFVETAIVE